MPRGTYMLWKRYYLKLECLEKKKNFFLQVISIRPTTLCNCIFNGSVFNSLTRNCVFGYYVCYQQLIFR